MQRSSLLLSSADRRQRQRSIFHLVHLRGVSHRGGRGGGSGSPGFGHRLGPGRQRQGELQQIHSVNLGSSGDLQPSVLPAQISYSLLEDRSGDHEFFRIDPELGFIYTQSVFDREAKSSYLLEVQSLDGWESARPGRHGQPNSGEPDLLTFDPGASPPDSHDHCSTCCSHVGGQGGPSPTLSGAKVSNWDQVSFQR